MAVMNSGLGGTAGYGEGTFTTAPKAAGDNIDGSVEVDISSVFGAAGLSFFGESYTSLYINSNGLITFGSADTSYFASDLADLAHPSIAPFWTDHNLENGGEIYWDVDPVAGKVTITFDSVAPYSGTGSNSYQLVLENTGNGNVDIQFIYENIGWHQSGSAPALTGLTDGEGNEYPLEGSGEPEALESYDGNGTDQFDGTFDVTLEDGEPENLESADNDISIIEALVNAFITVISNVLTAGADSLTATEGDDFVDAAEGADTVIGGAGSDTILGGAGDDQIFGDGDIPNAPVTETTTITASNYAQTNSGFRVTARNVENGALNSASTANIAAAMGGFGASGILSDSDSGVTQQTGFDLASGISEQLIVDFDEPVSDASFSFYALFTASYGEQAQWALYNNGTQIAQETFTEQGSSSGSGTIDLSGYGPFDQIVFTGLPQTDGTDGSDFLITEITFERVVVGTEFGDSLSGGDGIDEIFGGLGADTIAGDAGDDTIFGEEGDDIIAGGVGNDSVLGGIGADTISGGDGDDYIDGGEGDDLLKTGIGNDTLVGGEGSDTLRNSAGDDSLVGGTGDDELVATLGNDTLEGGEGNDTLMGGLDNDSADGGGGNDLILGDLAGVDFNATGTDGVGIASNITDFPTTALTYELTFSSTASPSGITPLGSYAVNAGQDEFAVFLENGVIRAGFDNANYITTGVNLGPQFDGNVHTLALTWDSSSGAIEVYLDGASVFSGTTGAGTVLDQGGTFVLGQEQDAVGGGFDAAQIFEGTIYGAQLYNDVRTPAEILSSNQGPVADTSDPNLVANWVAAPNSATFNDQTGSYPMTTSGDVAATWSAGNDTLLGGDGADTIYGGGGADSIEGGAGSDTLFGGAGDDTINTGDGGTLPPGTVIGSSGFEIGTTGSDTFIWDTSTASFASVTLGDNTGGTSTGDGVADSVYVADTGDASALVVNQFDAGIDQIILAETPVSIVNSNADGSQSDFTVTYANGSVQFFDIYHNGGVTTDPSLFFAPEPWTGGSSVEGGAGNDSIIGGTGADTIAGGTGDDYIEGGAGNDFLTTGLGNDTLMGGSGNDTLMNSDGDDSLDGGAGDDSIVATGGEDTLRGGTGADTMEGGDDADTFIIEDGFGNDVITGGEGTTEASDTDDDVIDLSAVSGPVTVTYTGDEAGTITDGTDTITFSEIERIILTDHNDSVDATADGVGVDIQARDGDDTVHGSHAADSIDGGAGHDQLYGNDGNDTLRGGTGNDTFYGGDGADSMDGGDGADQFFVQNGFGNDTIVGGEGGTDDDVIDLSGMAGPVTVTYDSDGAESGTITDGTDTITFSEIERIILTNHNDFVDGSTSHTGLVGDAPGINVDTRSGDDTIIGGRGGDTIAAGEGADSVEGGHGDDSIAGGAGNDTIYGDYQSGSGGSGNDTITGGAGSDFIDGGDQADTLSGGADNDTILGGEGDDSIEGGPGNDSLSGGDGADTVRGGIGNDTISGGQGNDSLEGGDDADTFVLQDGFGNDTILGGEGGTDNDVVDLSGLSGPVTVHYNGDETGTITDGTDTITFSQIERIITTDHNDSINGASDSAGLDIESGAGNDTIWTGFGDDSINSGTGDDVILASTGADTIDGGDGNDQLNYWNSDAALDIDLSDNQAESGGHAEGDSITGVERIDGSNAHGDTIVADDSGMRIYGHGGDDSLVGGAGNDSLSGGEGNDTINGGGGADTLQGAGGSDTFIVQDGFGNDTINGGTDGDGSDVDTIDLSALSGPVTVTYTSDQAGTITDGSDTITFSEIERIITTDQADVVDASSQTGTTGIDVETRDGDDTITGSSNNDTINAGAGADTIEGGDGSDSIDGGAGNDTIFYGDGNNTVNAGDGDDYLDDESGNTGYTGANQIDLGAGNDTIYSGYGNDTIQGGTGDDHIHSQWGNDSVDGGDGNDSIVNEWGASTLQGGAGHDTIEGGFEDDTIGGGTGNDSLTGSDGDDTFVYNVGDGHDTITDFNTGNSGAIGDGDTTNNDFIDLSGFYDNLSELRADFDDDGVLNQSNSTANGGDVDYSDNSQFQSSDSLTFQNADQSSFRADNTGVACFTNGTLIRTPRGETRIEDLRIGDLVDTLDHGPQRICWIGTTSLGVETLAAQPNLRPVEIKQGTLGARRDLLVSPQHCMLIDPDTLARAKHLADAYPGIRIAHGKLRVTYIHLMFETHQIIFAEGAPSESFYPGPMTLQTMDPATRITLFRAMPWLSAGMTRPMIKRLYGPTARRIAKRHEVREHKGRGPRQQVLEWV